MTRATRTRAQSKASAPGARGRRRPSPTSGATSAKNTPAILQAIVRTAARLCEASNAHIYRVDGDRLRLLAYSGSEPVRHVGQEVPITRELLSGQAVLDRRTIHVRDVQTAAARRRYPGLRGFRHLRSMLAAPLLHDDAAVGLIIIHRSRVRPFTAKQIALLRTFADQAAIALENERLREELEDRNRDLTEALEQQTATSEILRAISSSPTEVGPVFATILDKAMTLVGAQLGVLWRYEGDEMFRAIEVRGARPELRALLQEPQRFGRPLFRTNGPWRPGQIADVRESEPYRRGEPLWVNNADREGMRTLLNVPLVSDARFLGTISLYRREVRAFTGKEIALLQTFADQAVIAIENVRLFTELQARNRDLTEALEQQTATGEILRVLSQLPHRCPAGVRRDLSQRRPSLRGRLRNGDRGHRPRAATPSGTWLQQGGARGPAAGLPHAPRWAGTVCPGDPRSRAAPHPRHRGVVLPGLRSCARLPQHCGHPRVPRRAGHRCHRRGPRGVRSILRSPDRAASNLRRPGRHRHRERAPVRGAGAPQQGPHGIARAADSYQRDPARHLGLADRRSARLRHDRAKRRVAVRRDVRYRAPVRWRAGTPHRPSQLHARGPRRAPARVPDGPGSPDDVRAGDPDEVRRSCRGSAGGS